MGAGLLIITTGSSVSAESSAEGWIEVSGVADPSDAMFSGVLGVADPSDAMFSGVLGVADPSDAMFSGVLGVADPSDAMFSGVSRVADPSDAMFSGVLGVAEVSDRVAVSVGAGSLLAKATLSGNCWTKSIQSISTLRDFFIL